MYAVIERVWTFEGARRAFVDARIEPIGGFEWLEQAFAKAYPEARLQVSYKGQVIADVTAGTKHRRRTVKVAIKGARE